MILTAEQALQNAKRNRFAGWHGAASGDVTPNADDASNRIHQGYAKIVAKGPTRRLDLKAPVFTMGSCFAREIESALTAAGGNVVSLDLARMDRPEFRDDNGNVRTGFFHRFTPRALWHEFRIAFDEAPGWQPQSTLLFNSGKDVVDFNYMAVKGFDLSEQAVLTRRALASDFVRRVTESELIILTLGLVESWIHRPTGLHCNRIHPGVVMRRADEFELSFLDQEDTLFCLTDILRMLESYHRTGDFQLVVTVSPVPLQSTFSSDDVVVANETSKSTLRASAARFVADNPKVLYFPSYEFVRFSDPALAWRPDRLHVQRGMVQHIVRNFMETYFAQQEPKADVAA